MTEVAVQEIKEKEKEEEHSPVHQIADSEPVNMNTQGDQSSGNTGDPHRVRRKRKKHKKRHHHHRDPEEIREIRAERFNVKRQGQWNARFINDTIPDLFASKRRGAVTVAKRKRVEHHVIRRANSPLQTVYLDKDIVKNKLPSISSKNQEDESKKTQKSFNIRTVGGRKLMKKGKKTVARSEQGVQETKKQQHIKQKVKIEEKPNRQKYASKSKQNHQQLLKAKLQQRTKIYSTPQQYKQLLQDLILLYGSKKNKELKILLEHEINSIGHAKNNYTVIENMIKDRKGKIKGILETGDKTTLGVYLKFQMVSVALIEEILKFKAKWQEQFHNLDQPRKINFIHEGANYLFSMKQEVSQLCPQNSDPFLVSRTNALHKLLGSALKQQEQKERRQMMVKIRACELLLIEQQLLGQQS